MAGYYMPNFNPEIDRARKTGDQAAWTRLVSARGGSSNASDRVDALVEAHFAVETVRDGSFRDRAAAQVKTFEQALKQTSNGRITLVALGETGSSGRTRLQQMIDNKAAASGAAISPQHATLALKARGVIRQSSPAQ